MASNRVAGRWPYALLQATATGLIGLVIVAVGWTWLNPIFPLTALGGVSGSIEILVSMTWWIVVAFVLLLVLLGGLGRRGGRVSVRVLLAVASGVLGPLAGVAVAYDESGLSSDNQLTLALIYTVLAVYLIIGFVASTLLVSLWLLPPRRRQATGQ